MAQTTEKMPDTTPLTLAERALEIERILNQVYGAPFLFFSRKDPFSQLVSALLSHRTKNKISSAAYHSLWEKYGDWQAVIDAPTEEVEEAIKVCTFPEVKAPRIQEALAKIKERTGELSLDFLSEMSVPDARAWLEEIKGIGAKTSAAVLNFSRLRMPALVVDTHHQRVAQRTGVVPKKASIERASKLLQSYLPEDYTGQQVYDAHQAYMRHGQRICTWSNPKCEQCAVRHLCDYYAERKLRS